MVTDLPLRDLPVALFLPDTNILFVSAVSVVVLLGMCRRGGCLDFWCKSLFAVSVEIDMPGGPFRPAGVHPKAVGWKDDVLSTDDRCLVEGR